MRNVLIRATWAIVLAAPNLTTTVSAQVYGGGPQTFVPAPATPFQPAANPTPPAIQPVPAPAFASVPQPYGFAPNTSPPQFPGQPLAGPMFVTAAPFHGGPASASVPPYASASFAASPPISDPAVTLASAAPDAPATAATKGLTDLQKQFDELKAKLGATTYPNVAINGVFQADTGFFNQDAASIAQYGRIQDGASFRRARLSAKGSITETMNYFFQMDFAFFGRPTFTDVWLEQTQLPLLGNVRVGQWKQPFCLEVVSSFRYTTFMERSLLFQPFTPFRHLGAGFYNHANNLKTTWAASVFRTGQDQFGGSISTDGGWGTAERFTFCPYYDEPADGRYYLHTGLAHFLSAPPNDTFNFRSVPEFFIGENAAGVVGTSGQAVPGALNGTPFFVATGPLGVRNYNVLGTELLWVHGPLSVQAEAMGTYVQRTAGPNVTFGGFYTQVGYFLTGEHRPYDRVTGAIDRIKPFENFFRIKRSDGPAGGWGAWEVAGRVSHLTLDSHDVRGGRITNLTLGVNWYMNAYSKLVFNYIHAAANVDPIIGTSNTNIFGTMAQMDF